MEDEKIIRTEAQTGDMENTEGKELEPLDFSTFILSLSTSVLMNLGLVENPVTGKTEKEPAVARQTIELITLLKEKTSGNLSDEEAKLMDNVLHELRLWYVKAIS